MSEKMRVHILARELSVPSKTIVEKCRAEGIDVVKNHMTTLSAGLEATIREWFSEGSHDTAVETAQRVDLKKVRIKSKKRAKEAGRPTPDSVEEAGVQVVATAVAETETAPSIESRAEPTIAAAP